MVCMRLAGVSDLCRRHGDGMGEEHLACCYGNLIDAAGSRSKSTLCAELVSWKCECHVANQTGTPTGTEGTGPTRFSPQRPVSFQD
jgi:hypothetical protein